MMSPKTAIITVTKNGTELGQRLAGLLPESYLFIPAKFATGQGKDWHAFQGSVRQVAGEVLGRYENVVLITAVGIAVRLVSPELKSKHQDPAVVVVDEKGQFVVSLLSGHIGGANELTRKIASLIGAQPVITTASEIDGTIAVDLLGREFGWTLENKDNVTRVSAALINSEEVGIYQDAGEKTWQPRDKPLQDNILIFTSLASLLESTCSAALIITDRLLGKEYSTLLERAVVYRPKSLVVGIGCNQGVSCSQIEEAVKRVFLEQGLSIASIRNLATIELKSREQGLLEFARVHAIPIDFFTKEALNQLSYPSSPSNVTFRHVGVHAVCEPAVLLSSKNDFLVVPKTKLGDITIAVARVAQVEKI